MCHGFDLISSRPRLAQHSNGVRLRHHREPTLSADVFTEALQAYGYRYNVFNKWVRDHHAHTEYEVAGTAEGSKIVEKNTQVQWANQRRASLCNVAPVIHDD